MLKTLTLRNRLILNLSLTGIVFLLISLGYVAYLREGLVNQAIAERSEALNSIFQERLQAKQEFGLGLAMTLAGSPLYQSALLDGDRELAFRRANELGERFYSDLQAGTVNMHIHTADGRTWLRSWSRDFFDDDITFRPTVTRMMSERRPFSDATEVGRSGLTIRALAPMFRDRQYIGALEVAMGFDGIRQGFEADGRRYVFLLPADIIDVAPGVANNTKIGDFLVANDRWFGQAEVTFARSLDQTRMMADGFILNDQWFASIQEVRDDAGRLIGVHVFGEPPETVLASVRQMTQFISLLIGLLILLVVGMGIVLALMVQKNIVSLISRNVEQLNKNKNDLTLLLDTGKNQDELFALFSAFNDYTNTLKQILGEVSLTASDLKAATTDLVRQGEASQRMAVQQTEEVSQVASASAEMSASATQVAAQADSTQEAANQATAQTHEGVQVVGDTVSAIDQLASEMGELLTILSRLEQGSEKIGDVINTIDTIAEQTNLLALNAAIEAARAGEHGRGFAVVADEVRQLASRTQGATGEIQTIIHSVQDAAADVSKAIERGAEKANHCATQAQQAGAALNGIDASVSQVNEWGAQIATAASEQSQVAEGISSSLARINDLVAESLDEMQKSQEVTNRLAERADSLSQLISRFKI